MVTGSVTVPVTAWVCRSTKRRRWAARAATGWRPGMVSHGRAGHLPGGPVGVRIEDTVLVTADGCERLTTYPKELQVVG